MPNLNQRFTPYRSLTFRSLTFSLLVVSFQVPIVSAQSDLEKSLELTRSAHENSAKVQVRINRLSEQTLSVVDDLLASERQLNLVKAYNIQMHRLLSSQEAEKENLAKQIDSIAETEQAMLPLLVVMLDRLRELVAQDLPFKLDERNAEVAMLDALIDRADVSVAEKYRQILEAYENEVDYGRSIEAYTASLIGFEDIQVSYLRVGRTALFHQTIDGSQGALWVPSDNKWAVLDRSANLNLSKAMQIAQQQRVPELLSLPLVSGLN